MKEICILKNEKGAALLTTLMLLFLLILIGMAATDTTILERQIASYEAIYRREFYKADSGISYALRLSKSDYSNKTAGDSITVPTDSPFELKVYKTVYSVDSDSGPVDRVEVMSKSKDPATPQGVVELVAGIQFPTARTGMQIGPGNETNYN